jgi:hypothetical protein
VSTVAAIRPSCDLAAAASGGATIAAGSGSVGVVLGSTAAAHPQSAAIANRCSSFSISLEMREAPLEIVDRDRA